MKHFVFVLALVCATGLGWSATVTETFDIDDRGVGGPCTDTPASCTFFDFTGVTWTISGDASEMTASSDYLKTAGGTLTARDVGAEMCWESPVYDISAGTADFSVDIDETGSDHEASDYVDVTYFVDGAPTTITNWNGLGDGTHTLIGDIPDDNDWGFQTVTQGALNGSTLQLQICILNTAGSEYIYLDNIIVNTDDAVQVPGLSRTVTIGIGFLVLLSGALLIRRLHL